MVTRHREVGFVFGVCIVLGFTAFFVHGGERKADEVHLPKALDTFLKQKLAPAYATGHPTVLLKVLRSRLPRLSDRQIERINMVLESRMLPTIEGMLGQAYLHAQRTELEATQGMSVKEVCLATRYTWEEIERLLARVRAVRLMKDPLPQPASLDEFRDLLWVAHVQKNELLGVKDLLRLGEELPRRLSTNVRRNATQPQVAILETNFAPYHTQVADLLRDLDERTVELRVDRIEFAVITLLEEQDLKQRFIAASPLAVDSEELIKRIQTGRGQFHRDTLNDPSVLDQLVSNSKEGEELAGDLIKKSKLLYAGLHWWLRGRYGSGPEGNGLLKAQTAERNPEARIPLFMPRARPVPTDPLKLERRVPDYDRRHHYTWAWQDQQFVATTFTRREIGYRPTTGAEHLDFRLNGRFY